MPFFVVKNKTTVYSPKSPALHDFYAFLERYSKPLGGSEVYTELLSLYETLDYYLGQGDTE